MGGVVVVPGFLGPRELTRLQEICDSVLNQIRAASTERGHTKTNIAFLTEPEYFQRPFEPLLRQLEFIASEKIRELIRNLLPVQRIEERLLFHNTQYLHEQTKQNWDGDWHRDSQFLYPDPDEEKEFIFSTTPMHFRVAFVGDAWLQFVPGSHLRSDTTEEHIIRKGEQPNAAEMPGARRIDLRPGDACVFNACGIHRGTYRTAPLRRTLDLVYGLAPCPPGPAVPPPTCFEIPEIMSALSKDSRGSLIDS